MKIGITVLLCITLSADVFCQNFYAFQYNGSSYTNYADVTIKAGHNDRCFGDVLHALWSGSYPLIKFSQLNVPPGNYRYDLHLNISSITSAGSLQLIFLKRKNWSDPNTDLNPCPPSGLYPTWSHVRYDTEAWEQTGAEGASDKGPFILTKTNISTPGLLILSGGTKQITFESRPGELAFIIYPLSCDLHFYCRESSGGNYTLNPKLILYPIKNYRSELDFNPVFHPFPRLEPLRE